MENDVSHQQVIRGLAETFMQRHYDPKKTKEHTDQY